MKRKGAGLLLLGLVVVVGGWWLLGCGSGAPPEEGVVDVWATWGDGPEYLQALLDRYSAASGVAVRVRTRVRADDLQQALDSAEKPDLVILSNADPIGFYGQQGMVEPLDAWLGGSGVDLEEFYAAPLAQCESPAGTTLCLPWGCDADALYWNKDLFAAAGLDPERPPSTLEELVVYASRLTTLDEEGELRQVGFLPDLVPSHTDLYARMFGGGLYADDGASLTVNSQAVVDALNWQMELRRIYAETDLEGFRASFDRYAGSRHPLFAGRRLDCQQCHRSSSLRADRLPASGFTQGQVAMMVSGAWHVGATAGLLQEAPMEYGVAPFPAPLARPEQAHTTVVRGPVVMLPAGAIDREAAQGLLAWMMSPEIVAEVAYDSAMLPTSRTAAQDPRFGGIPDYQVFLELVTHPNAGGAGPAPISRELNEALARVEDTLLERGGDAMSLLDEVQAELAPRLEEATVD